jgi:hypothetical protein
MGQNPRKCWVQFDPGAQAKGAKAQPGLFYNGKAGEKEAPM